ncbi:hypothetical protein PHK61_18670 [Actinomycetospora lutea]|uniref:hypothetical protein n=1 Tax=Actinomycetospora lutea TaxID=663604 RepID=UPI002365D7EE|nr:hypothetical protein [Actinomycetospora lutea]MDD7940452.1 hypothetical protein [Actinomycetospora lutea]
MSAQGNPDRRQNGQYVWDLDAFELTVDGMSQELTFWLDDRSFGAATARRLHAALGWALGRHTTPRKPPDRTGDGVDVWEIDRVVSLGEQRLDPFKLTHERGPGPRGPAFQLDDWSFGYATASRLRAALGWALAGYEGFGWERS